MKKVILPMLAAALIVGCTTVTRDTQLTEEGFHSMAANNLVVAEQKFQEALEINPQNPYTLLNLGALYQNTGRTELARQTYQRLIDSGSTARAAKSTKDEGKGKLLTDIARDNLRLMGF